MKLWDGKDEMHPDFSYSKVLKKIFNHMHIHFFKMNPTHQQILLV